MAINKRLIKSNDEAAAGGDFNTVIWTGNGSTQSITGVGFQPDFSWIKNRNNTQSNRLYDSVRGVGLQLSSNQTAVEGDSGGLISFDSDGFSLDNWASVNTNGYTYVAWNWKAAGYANTFNVLENGSTTSSATAAGAGITAGSNTSNWSVSANRDAGFSVVKWTYGNSINTVGHGLDNVPKLILIKTLDQAADWQIYSSEIGNTFKLIFDGDVPSATTRWDSTDPTSDVFTLRDIGLVGDLVAYCFAEVAGFSKFGSYDGIASGDITINCGFEPALVIIKGTTAGGQNWIVLDNKRSPNANAVGTVAKRINLEANTAETDWNPTPVVFTATGFYTDSSVTSNNYNDIDRNGNSYIYMAFANQF